MKAELVVKQTARLAELIEQQGLNPVMVCSPQLRMPLHSLLKVAIPRLPVLSYTEIAESPFRVESLGVVSDADALAA